MNEKENNRIKVDASMEHRIYFKDNWGIIKCSIEKVRSGDGIYKGDLIIFKGQMPQPIEGCIYTIIADFVHDPKWGDQYVIQSIFTAVTEMMLVRRNTLVLYSPLIRLIVCMEH